MIIMRLLALTLSFAAAGWSSAWGCSPPPPMVTPDKSYEETLEQFLRPTHRNIVDKAEHIVVGTLKYSKRKQVHRLQVSEILKAPPDKKLKKKFPVTFNEIADENVSYKEQSNDSKPCLLYTSPSPRDS